MTRRVQTRPLHGPVLKAAPKSLARQTLARGSSDFLLREASGVRAPLAPLLVAPTLKVRLRSLALTGLITGTLVCLRAAEEPAQKAFFLPKSPVAAAYVLGRLSNKELIDAPRSEFVYVALLQRRGLERKYRVEGLAGLAKLRNTDLLTELLAGLADLDKKGEASEAVLRDLSAVLLQAKPEELTARHAELEKLATESQLALTRQIGCAAIVTANRSAEKI